MAKTTETKATETEAKKTFTVNLFYDGEKYKDPLFVGVNGKTWLIKRGEPVEVPEEVYNTIMESEEATAAAYQKIKELQAVHYIDM